MTTWTRPHRDALHPSAAAVLAAVLVLPAPVTVRRIGAHVGLGPSSVHWHLRSLRNAGYVAWETGRHSTITSTLTPTPPPTRKASR